MKRLLFIIILLVLVFPADAVFAAGEAWYDVAWLYREKITIDHTKVDSDLAGFPVLLDGDGLSNIFWSSVLDDGSDIVVTSDDGETVLYRELVGIDTPTHQLELWFRAPTLSSTVDDIFYIYYGNPNASIANDPETWDDYGLVYHMRDFPDNAHVSDSTAYGSDGDKAAANQPSESVGDETMYAQDFVRANPDYITIPAIDSGQLDFTSEDFSFIARVYPDDISNHPFLICRGQGNVNGWMAFVRASGELRVQTNQGAASQWTDSAAGSIAAGSWQTIAFSRDGADVDIYINGVLSAGVGGVHIDPVNSGQSVKICIYDNLINQPFDCKVELLCVYEDVALTSSWHLTAHNSVSDPGSFYGVSDFENNIDALIDSGVLIGGASMIPFGLLILCLGLTIISMGWKLFPLMIVTAVAWFGAAATFLGSYTIGDIEWVVGPVAMMAGVYCIVHALWLIPRPRKRTLDDEQEDYRRTVSRATKRRPW